MSESNYEVVKNALGTKTADAIRSLAREQAEDVVKGLREEITELVAKQKQNIETAKDEGSPEAKASANESTVAVQEADKAVKEASDDPTPEKVAVAEQKTEEAKEKVEQTESDLASKVAKHDNELYNEKTGLVARVKKLEDNHTGLSSKVEGLAVSVRDQAKAIAFGTTAGLARIARLAIVVFLIVALLWLGTVLFLNKVTLGNSWSEGLGLAAIAAGLMFLIKAAMLDGKGKSAKDDNHTLSIMSDDEAKESKAAVHR